MTHNELVDYIVNELRNGTSEAEIRNALVASGWHENDISENLAAAHTKMGLSVVSHQDEPKAKREFLKKHSKAVIIMSIGALLLAGAAFAAYKFIPLSPERMLQQSILKMEGVHSFDFSGRITADVTANDNILELQARLPEIFNLEKDNRVAGTSTSLEFAVDFKGSVDGRNENDPKAKLDMDFTSGIFTIGMKMLLSDQTLYMRVDNIPKISEEISKYSNTWIKIDPKTISEEYGVGLDFDSVQPTLTDGQKEQIRQLTRTARIYNSVTRLEDDSLDGVGMYRYSVVIDKAGLKKYLQDVEKINKAAGGLSNTSLDAIDSMQFKNVEIWIGKSDRMLHRFSMEIAQASSNDTIPSGSMHLLMNFSKYNEIPKIQAPSQFQNLQDVIQELSDSNWKTYNGSAEGVQYQISYPGNWRVVEQVNGGAGFGPRSFGSEVVWEISVEHQNSRRKTTIIADLEQDFKKGYVIKKDNITLPSGSATRINISKPDTDFSVQYIVIQVGSIVYTMSVGPQLGIEESFEQFYNSFRVIK